MQSFQVDSGMREGSLSRAERNIRWCEDLIRIPEGKFVGQPLRMAEFMKEDFRAIFDNPHGTRRAIISRARKNAKTVETALLMLLFLCGPEQSKNAQLYSAARSKDQAAVLFKLAAKMVRMSPELSAAIVIRDTLKELFCPELGSLYKALSAEASTAFGLSPRFLAHDELGQVRGPNDHLYEALETATAAQDQPISIIISTQAPDAGDLLSVLIDDALGGHDPRTIIRLNTCPEGIDPFTEEAIRLANPAYDIFMNQREVQDMAASAKRLPSREAEYRNLVLNQRISLHSPFIPRTLWTAGDVAIDEEAFEDGIVFAGLDLSARHDLTALVLVAQGQDRVWNVKSHFFAPADGLAARSTRDRAPYDLWAKQGHLEVTPGASVDYEVVAGVLADYCDQYNISLIAFDRWRIDVLKSELKRLGLELPLVPFGQGFKDMSPALDTLEAELMSGRIRHGGHPVLRWNAANAIAVRDPAGNRKLDKSKATGRIDGLVSMAMAMGAGTSINPERKPEYQMMVFG